MKTLQNIEDSFGKETGSPTLTLRLGKEERMIPWASFLGGRYSQGKIQLGFQEWDLTVTGRDLESLWQACQMQDVRWIRMMEAELIDQWDGDCVVVKIQLAARES